MKLVVKPLFDTSNPLHILESLFANESVLVVGHGQYAGYTLTIDDLPDNIGTLSLMLDDGETMDVEV